MPQVSLGVHTIDSGRLHQAVHGSRALAATTSSHKEMVFPSEGNAARGRLARSYHQRAWIQAPAECWKLLCMRWAATRLGRHGLACANICYLK